jgi:hypothetical protein
MAARRAVLLAAIVSNPNRHASDTFFQQYLNPILQECNGQKV